MLHICVYDVQLYVYIDCGNKKDSYILRPFKALWSFNQHEVVTH